MHPEQRFIFKRQRIDELMEALLYTVLAVFISSRMEMELKAVHSFFYSIRTIYHLLTFTAACCLLGIKEILHPNRAII